MHTQLTRGSNEMVNVGSYTSSSESSKGAIRYIGSISVERRQLDTR